MDVSGKKIALLGFGLENQALLPYLKDRGAIIVVCDRNEKIEMGAGGDFRLGQDYLKNLSDFEIIFRSPGIPYLTPEIQEAKKAGVIVTSQTKLFFDEFPGKITGITGTKGKGTTASLVNAILQEAKKQKGWNGQVYLGGNIGKTLIDILETANRDDWAIL